MVVEEEEDDDDASDGSEGTNGGNVLYRSPVDTKISCFTKGGF